MKAASDAPKAAGIAYLAALAYLLYRFLVLKLFRRSMPAWGSGMNKYIRLFRFEFKGASCATPSPAAAGFPALLLGLSCFVLPRVLRALPPMKC